LRLADQHPVERVIMMAGEPARCSGVPRGHRQLDEAVCFDLLDQVGTLEVQPAEVGFDGKLPDGRSADVDEGRWVSDNSLALGPSFGLSVTHQRKI
jgi:hypothetical protein